MRKCMFVLAASLLLSQAAAAEDRMTVDGVQYATTSGSTVTACLTVKATGNVEIAERIKIINNELI